MFDENVVSLPSLFDSTGDVTLKQLLIPPTNCVFKCQGTDGADGANALRRPFRAFGKYSVVQLVEINLILEPVISCE